MGRGKGKIMDTVDKKVNIYFGGTNPHDEDLECVCDRCDVKITEEEKAYAYKFETICEECEDNND